MLVILMLSVCAGRNAIVALTDMMDTVCTYNIISAAEMLAFLLADMPMYILVEMLMFLVVENLIFLLSKYFMFLLSE